MASEWAKVSITEVAVPVIGGTPNRNVPDYWNGDIPWATAKDVAGVSGRYLDHVQEFISEIGLESSAAKLMPKGTVVITARGTVGAVAQLSREMAFNQTCYGLLAKETIIPDFLYYVLKGSLSEMQSLSYGTVFDTITTKSFDHLKIPLPSLHEQCAIAAILGALDDKIELNMRMNKTLEAMAAAIFKSWFIDFEPFQDGEFVDSDLGPIPKSWKVKFIGDVLELAYGKGLPEKARCDGSIPVYGSNGIVGWHNEKLVDGPGIVVGRKGNPGIVTWSHGDFFPIDTTFYVRSKASIQSMFYLYFALRMQNLPHIAADSAIPGLNRNLAYMSTILVPPASVIKKFDLFIAPAFERIHHNELESHALAQIRDTLLPKLLSGELRVRDVNSEVS